MTSSNQPEGSSFSETLETHVGSLITALDKGMAKVLVPYGLIVLEFKLLKFCLGHEECTATQLADVLPTDPARISRLVNSLVEMGFLARRRLPNDRRIVMLSLTDAGRERITESDRAIQEFFQALVLGISDEDLGAFASAALTMTANYDALAQGPATDD